MSIINKVLTKNTATQYRIERTLDSNGVLQCGSTFIDLTGIIGLGDSALAYAFSGCINLTTPVVFTGITTLDNSCLQNCFQNCTGLTSISFPDLKSTSFGSYTNQFNNMLLNVTDCTVHFPSNLQGVIGSWADITAGFGGTNTVVLWDLPATE